MCHASGGIEMCDVTVQSGLAQRTSRPRWGLLYGLMALMIAALAAAEVVVTPGRAQTVLQCALALGGFSAMALWARLNRRALDQEDWCECAASKVSVRVIGSRRRAPARVEAEETLEEVVS